jgi:hypothetical protein
MTIDEAINQMLTCAPTGECRHESACFLVAQTLNHLRRAQAVSNEPDPKFVVKQPEPLTDLTVDHYAPTWEYQRRMRNEDVMDWSAA